jgi:hypothetical protein
MKFPPVSGRETGLTVPFMKGRSAIARSDPMYAKEPWCEYWNNRGFSSFSNCLPITLNLFLTSALLSSETSAVSNSCFSASRLSFLASLLKNLARYAPCWDATWAVGA